MAALSCSHKEQLGGEYILFEVHGTVMSQDGAPIEGIVVTSGMADQVKTNLNGKFTFHGRSNPSEFVRLTFEDKDGDGNGGQFLKREVSIQVNLKIAGDEDGNFKGKYFAQDVEVVMIPKTSDMDPDNDLDTGSGLI